eukprot:16442178-Heterocapsa_arctica.AAC.1
MAYCSLQDTSLHRLLSTVELFSWRNRSSLSRLARARSAGPSLRIQDDSDLHDVRRLGGTDPATGELL